jgi:flagellar protein FliS
MNAALRYGQTQNQTSSRERIMVLLFQAALRHMRNGAAALEQSRRADATQVLNKANDIVLELHATLDARVAPQLAEQLGEIYRFVASRLLSAMMRGDPQAVREAERAFAPLVDAFEQAEAQSRAGGQP